MQDTGYFEEAATWTTLEQMMDGTLRYIRTESPAFAPGAGDRYSNSGYHVLGCIVQKVSGQSYYDYVRAHVFRPAGMTDSDFTTLPQWRSGSRYAHPYPTDQSGKRYDPVRQLRARHLPHQRPVDRRTRRRRARRDHRRRLVPGHRLDGGQPEQLRRVAERGCQPADTPDPDQLGDDLLVVGGISFRSARE